MWLVERQIVHFLEVFVSEIKAFFRFALLHIKKG